MDPFSLGSFTNRYPIQAHSRIPLEEIFTNLGRFWQRLKGINPPTTKSPGSEGKLPPIGTNIHNRGQWTRKDPLMLNPRQNSMPQKRLP